MFTIPILTDIVMKIFLKVKGNILKNSEFFHFVS